MSAVTVGCFNMAYTFISKPVGTTYTNTNPIGKQEYDQFDIMYDDPNTFYDGIDMNQYTNIPKPVLSSLTWEDLTGLTWSDLGDETWGDLAEGYIKIPKPI